MATCFWPSPDQGQWGDLVFHDVACAEPGAMPALAYLARNRKILPPLDLLKRKHRLSSMRGACQPPGTFGRKWPLK